MPTYRCSDCGISYPASHSFKECPVHGTQNAYFNNASHDDDWSIQLAVLREQLAPTAVPESLDDLIPLVETKVIIRPGGAYFVSSWDVHRALRHYKPIDYDAGQLFRVGKQTFEILQYLEDAREYWVRPFAITLSDEEVAQLLGV